MKKILFVLPIVALLAAGCNSSQQPSVQTQTPTANVQQTNNAPIANIIPQGAETAYKDIFNQVATKCGNNIQLAYYFSLKNSDLNNQQIDTYTFTAGTCGSDGQVVNALYNRDTQEITVDANALNNTNNLLRPFPLSDWNINYNQAITIALNNGGQTFLNNNAGSRIAIAGLAYRQNQPFQWQVEFKSADGNTKLNIFIDPKSGDVISKQ